ncbi:PTH1 family peptidyl-tRNA hydrolase [Thermosporothrix hazakensis]|jgi:PTH1 family peptidyl-tRNA hydrolase|uniref:Peptidyl-tRNA hydrolase n=2 Tax=Thermosporothrix TaxID=768650 RepID=A0A326TVQ4_THEHA|nr:aminoacyl-tRNA hydrolase [Thermosporothrix hazakensis]PZW21006.1 PTH1 family peptidyl-tRNA hydrolase [Thermosporothrix hazakensis]BBH91144.1 peptidyl-tRNA hydrolase [Thermosporothrix sp. COM3]GCE49289.1 peptidyl-tRNA hydrolase [Thermosporothrix hazakensis]
MKLIVGLGNPGDQYTRTRHNVGFRVVDILASQHQLRWERKGKAMIAQTTLATEKVVLVKPITFMNNSGEAVADLVRWYKLQPQDVLVIYDELDLPPGRIRLKTGGSSAGHNGIKSIIRYLHTDQFPRVRVGIGHPANTHMRGVDYVLGIPTRDELTQLSEAEDRAAELIPFILEKGVEAAMNTVNADPEALRKAEERRRLQQERRQRQLREQQSPAEEEMTPGQ